MTLKFMFMDKLTILSVNCLTSTPMSLWRYDDNNVRLHSSLGNQTPAEARRALEQLEGSAQVELAQTDDDEYEIQNRKLSL